MDSRREQCASCMAVCCCLPACIAPTALLLGVSGFGLLAWLAHGQRPGLHELSCPWGAAELDEGP